jgi:predicted membrane GTPase involved in stress response
MGELNGNFGLFPANYTEEELDEAEAGDIIAISGLTTATVADTICDPTVTEPIFAQPIDPPTLTMTFRINDGPLAGKEGDKVQSRVIRDRLLRDGIEPVGGTPEEFQAHITREMQKWGKVVRDAKVAVQ